ncbi:MAG: T9SS C-terminal target domain-containing protein [Haliscomenobacteraceae bacterium CHB4]|nr:T9SS C-terminal target domain-containing protein [Haliscomenobacteraceae bacterium CHB4]
MLNDDQLLNVLELIKIDFNGNVISVISLPPPAFIVDAVFSEQGLVILESDRDSFGLRHLNLGGTMLNQVAFSCPLGAFPSKIKLLENGNYLLLFKEDNPSTGETNAIFWLLDGSMQQLWEEMYEENIVDFITDSDHRIYFVSRAGLSATNITALNADGSKANQTQPGTPDFVPRKIALTEDESALLMGIRWELSNQKPATEIIKIPLDTILLAPFPLARSVELKLSPNPASSFAQLPFAPDRAEVFNILGQRVGVSFSNEMLDVSALAPGIYQVLAEKDSVVYVGKLAVGR